MQLVNVEIKLKKDVLKTDDLISLGQAKTAKCYKIYYCTARMENLTIVALRKIAFYTVCVVVKFQPVFKTALVVFMSEDTHYATSRFLKLPKLASKISAVYLVWKFGTS
jgi:hypothetical protein